MMLELDKSGNWWLDGSIIGPWEITEEWTKLVNSAEAMADMIENQAALLWEAEEVLKECLPMIDPFPHILPGCNASEITLKEKKLGLKATDLLRKLEAARAGLSSLRHL